MAARRTLILLLAFLLFGCRPASPTPVAAPVTAVSTLPGALTTAVPTQTAPLVGITPREVKNSLYQLGATDPPREVQLVDGAFTEGKPGDANYLEVRVKDDIAIGDLTGDGTNEAAAIVSEYHGGSGVFVFLAVFSEENDQAAFQTSIFVDDRPKIGGIKIEDNEIRLLATVHRLDEPICCPTLETVRHYRLINNQLDMTDFATLTPDGKPRIITIDSPPYGMAVSGSVQVEGKVAVSPFENSLTYVIKDAGNVELSRGTVSVKANGLGGPGTFEARIPLSDILSGAVISIEIQDVSAADGSLLGMDSVRLVVK
ncbi:MAG: Gmad2 immunoglobulin-like domain-containing protein [Bacteroidota bacterium]